MRQFIIAFTSALLVFGLSIPTYAVPPAARPAAKKTASAFKEHRYYGDISDSNCGAHHKMASARDCTLACVKQGAKYVFVYRGKALGIANQDNPDLAKYAGEHVRVTGTRSHDIVTIASIAPVTRRVHTKKTSK